MQHTTLYTYKLNVAYFIIPKDFWYSEGPCTTSTFCHLEMLAAFQGVYFRFETMIISAMHDFIVLIVIIIYITIQNTRRVKDKFGKNKNLEIVPF